MYVARSNTIFEFVVDKPFDYPPERPALLAGNGPSRRTWCAQRLRAQQKTITSHPSEQSCLNKEEENTVFKYQKG